MLAHFIFPPEGDNRVFVKLDELFTMIKDGFITLKFALLQTLNFSKSLLVFQTYLSLLPITCLLPMKTCWSFRFRCAVSDLGDHVSSDVNVSHRLSPAGRWQGPPGASGARCGRGRGRFAGQAGSANNVPNLVTGLIICPFFVFRCYDICCILLWLFLVFAVLEWAF